METEVKRRSFFVQIDDDYEHADENLEYVMENVLSQSCLGLDEYVELEEKYNSVIVNPCTCSVKPDNCSSFDACRHGGNYILRYGERVELVLSESHQRDIFFECSAFCPCDHQCLNRLVQCGPRKGLKIIDSNKYKSRGLITTLNIPKGAFICEYAGELLTHSEARLRIADNEKHHRMNYILCLNEIKEESYQQQSQRHISIVDPSRRGNIGRYLNHSCAPNCKIYSVRVDCPIPKIAIFSKREILAGEELCFDYSEGCKLNDLQKSDELKTTESTPCLCGSVDCVKYLPSYEF